jgi:hypothetical protein
VLRKGSAGIRKLPASAIGGAHFEHLAHSMKTKALVSASDTSNGKDGDELNL